MFRFEQIRLFAFVPLIALMSPRFFLALVITLFCFAADVSSRRVTPRFGTPAWTSSSKINISKTDLLKSNRPVQALIDRCSTTRNKRLCQNLAAISQSQLPGRIS